MIQPKRKKKCRHCKKIFIPDPRNAHKQKYCADGACRSASKAASQARWRESEKGRDYFRGPENVHRVQEWRKSNPGYSGRKTNKVKDALQDHSSKKRTQMQGVAANLPRNALQDLLIDQTPVVVGLIASLTGSSLQDNIVVTTRNLQQYGADVLNSLSLTPAGGDYDKQTTHSSRPDP